MPRDILPVTEERVPSVIGMKGDEQLVIGRAAKELGIKGRTNTYHFKTELGKPQDDSQYEIKIGKGGKIRAAKAKPFWVTDPDSQKRHTFTPLEATRNFLRELIPDSDYGPCRVYRRRARFRSVVEGELSQEYSQSLFRTSVSGSQHFFQNRSLSISTIGTSIN